MRGPQRLRRTVSALAATALTAVALVAAPGAAVADTAPVRPGLPTTVTADALPTAQIDGVAWTQLVVGGTVFVGGSFTSARPAGAAAGTDEQPRANLLAYDLATGALLPWNPGTNGQVLDLAVSPDGATLYVAGQFTSVAGSTRYRVAAFDVATGALLSFRPTVNAGVLAVGVTDTAVVLGGNFTSVNGTARTNVAAVSPGAGTTTLPFAATVAGGNVQALVVAPDRASVVVSGSFTSVNGSSNPGYGLARLDATTGALLPLPANAEVRNAGDDAAMVSLESDGVNFYGSGYHFGRAGNVEGSFAVDWATGSVVWVEDCHGDTYSVYPVGDVVYQASHKHYCGNSGGFPQTEPWSYQRGTAVSKAVGGVNAPDIYGYPHHAGVASPHLLNWYPEVNSGTFTGKDQGPWTVSGSADGRYVVMGGEFTRVSGRAQQGLVRFAVSDVAPDAVGPAAAGAAYPLVASSTATGEVRLTWRTNRDADNETLTYSVYRTTQTAEPVYRTTVTTPFWEPQALTFLDTGRAPGASERYRVVVTDPSGNQAASDWVTVTVAGSGATGAYVQDVLDDAPSMLWRLGETSGSAVRDATGFADATAASGATRGVTGALAGDADRATTFSGTSSGYAASTTPTNAPDSFSVEAWVRTTSTRGGKVIGFGNRASGTSTTADRHLYLDNQGRVHFGLQSATVQTVSSGPGLNNGQWHHLVGTYDAGTMRLYVDGTEVASRSDVAWERAYWGYWRLGGDRLTGWPNDPTSDYLAGTVDEAAVYAYALPAAAVLEHRTTGVTGAATNRAPVASFTAAASNLDVVVDGSGSSDSDGTVAAWAWDFGDGATGDGASAAHTFAAAGTYAVTLTVTDDRGATATTTRSVVVTEPPPAGEPFGVDGFARTVANGWGVAERGGAWTTTGLASRFAVDGTRGLHTVVAGGTMTSALLGQQSQDTEVAVTVSADKVPNGSGAFVHVQGRRASATDWYGARVRLGADGSVQLHATRGNGSPLTGLVVPGLSVAAGDRLHVRLQVEGTAPTTLRAKVWEAGTTEPTAWQVTTTDATASLQAPGAVGLVSYLFGSATNGPLVVAYDDLRAGPPVAPANQAPVAAIAASATGLTLAVDGSGSSDPDGTVAAHVWDFGDGATASGVTASHTYAAAGTYPVTLTVTDDDGATAASTTSVTVAAPPANQPPVAVLTAATTHLAVALDSSGTTDPDGTVTALAWDLGDGTSATGPSVAHTYAAAGTYTVTLTATDDDGATATTSRQVTVTAPPAGVLAQDAFARAVTGGWGTAEVGGAWTSTGSAAAHAVDGDRARHTVAAGATLTAALTGVSSTSTDLRVVVSPDRVPNGSGAFVTVQGRRISATEHYAARVRLQADGSVQLHVTRGNGSPVAGVVVPGLTYAAGDRLAVRVQVTGTSPTTVRAKAWPAGAPEPADWQTQMTDSTASLQVPGAVGISSYLFGSATNGPLALSYDDLAVTPAG